MIIKSFEVSYARYPVSVRLINYYRKRNLKIWDPSLRTLTNKLKNPDDDTGTSDPNIRYANSTKKMMGSSLNDLRNPPTRPLYTSSSALIEVSGIRDYVTHHLTTHSVEVTKDSFSERNRHLAFLDWSNSALPQSHVLKLCHDIWIQLQLNLIGNSHSDSPSHLQRMVPSKAIPQSIKAPHNGTFCIYCASCGLSGSGIFHDYFCSSKRAKINSTNCDSKDLPPLSTTASTPNLGPEEQEDGSPIEV